MGTNENELTPPPLASEPGAIEVLRVWAKPDSPQQLSLQTTWADPGTWGLVLADVARHAAKAYAEQGHSERDAFDRIIALLKAELASPTDTPTRI